jgi:hypothetical protein
VKFPTKALIFAWDEKKRQSQKCEDDHERMELELIPLATQKLFCIPSSWDDCDEWIKDHAFTQDLIGTLYEEHTVLFRSPQN